MVKMIESADAGKTRIVRTTDRWATRLVLIVMVLVVLTYAFTQDIYRAVTIMIVFCPCAFILATPTAVAAAVGNLTKYGLLVKDGDALERLSQVDTLVFDKTGTVTEGRPAVVDVSPEPGADDMLDMVASAESRSEHPLGRTMVAHCREAGATVFDPEAFVAVMGRGVYATVGGRMVAVGNVAMMTELGVEIPDASMAKVDDLYERGCTSVFVAVDGRFYGTMSLSDTIREDSRDMVAELGAMGVRTMLLTGDNPRAALHIARSAGITEYRAECTPETKMDIIGEMQDSWRKVCMVGDGVNDAPALKRAWVGIAMGGTGSDIAVDAADLTLVGDRVENIPHTVDLSRKLMSSIRFNIAFSLVWNFIAVVLSMVGTLGPVEGALVHNVGSVFVVANSALLIMYHRRGRAVRAGARPRPGTV